MPPRSIPRTVGDFILYYYAKLVIAPSAGRVGDYRFIMDRYKRLKTGEIRMSDYDHEIQLLAERPGECAFCGKRSDTVLTEVVPRRLGGPIGMHNLVHACQDCARSKGDKDLMEWWCKYMGHDKESLPRIPAGLFLKLAYERHAIGFALQRPCTDILDIWKGGKSEDQSGVGATHPGF